jgi:hypothetical protein
MAMTLTKLLCGLAVLISVTLFPKAVLAQQASGIAGVVATQDSDC